MVSGGAKLQYNDRDLEALAFEVPNVVVNMYEGWHLIRTISRGGRSSTKSLMHRPACHEDHVEDPRPPPKPSSSPPHTGSDFCGLKEDCLTT
jgi:hypothetical protein